MGLNWSIKKDKREQPLCPPSLCGRSSEAVPGGDSGGDAWQLLSCRGRCQTPSSFRAGRAEVRSGERRGDAPESSYSQLLPGERVYSRKLLPFISRLGPRAGAGPDTCHLVRSPRAGSCPAPTPVTGVVAVSPFYIIAADRERLAAGGGSGASRERSGSCGAPRGRRGVALGIFRVNRGPAWLCWHLEQLTLQSSASRT